MIKNRRIVTFIMLAVGLTGCDNNVMIKYDSNVDIASNVEECLTCDNSNRIYEFLTHKNPEYLVELLSDDYKDIYNAEVEALSDPNYPFIEDYVVDSETINVAAAFNTFMFCDDGMEEIFNKVNYIDVKPVTAVNTSNDCKLEYYYTDRYMFILRFDVDNNLIDVGVYSLIK